MTVSDEVRKQLEKLCKSRKTRFSTFSPTLPTHWAPQHVRHPKTGEPFTPDGAWLFVAEQIASGVRIEAIELKKPPGKTGYVLIVPGLDAEQIYIKLQLGSGKVIGRSFHISMPKGLRS